MKVFRTILWSKALASPSHYTNRTRMSKKERSIVLSHRYIGVYPFQHGIPTTASGKVSQKKTKVKWHLKFICNEDTYLFSGKSMNKNYKTRLIFKRTLESWGKSSTPTLITPTLIY